MKLKFTPLDQRHTTFHAHLSDPEDMPLLAAFDDWCAASMPPPGDQWSRFEHEVPRTGPGASHSRPSRRIVVVFGDEGLARRFWSVWG